MILEEYLVWRFHAQALWWTVIEFIPHPLIYSSEIGVNFVFLGKYYLVKPFISSLSPRAHQAYGWAKKMGPPDFSHGLMFGQFFSIT